MYRRVLPDLAEITRRCKKRGVIKFTRTNGVYEFRIIKACEAKNYDGTNDDPYPASDPRMALERKFIRPDGSKRYSNHWGWGQE